MANNTAKKTRFRDWFHAKSIRLSSSASGPSSGPRPKIPTNPSGLLAPIATPTPSTCSTPNPAPVLFPVWQKSLEIVQNRLSKEKLPPLELHTHSSQSANEIAQETMRNLQQAIDTNQNGHGTVARKVQNIFVVFNKYIGVVDVAIQHSPEITALVWGGIRGILQVCFLFSMHFCVRYWLCIGSIESDRNYRKPGSRNSDDYWETSSMRVLCKCICGDVIKPNHCRQPPEELWICLARVLCFCVGFFS